MSGIWKTFQSSTCLDPQESNLDEDRFIAAFLQNLDPEYMFFNQKDVQEVSHLIKGLESIPNGFCFIEEKLIAIYKAAVSRTIPLLDSLIKLPYNKHYVDSAYFGDSYLLSYYSFPQERRLRNFIHHQAHRKLLGRVNFDSVLNASDFDEKILEARNDVYGRRKEHIQDIIFEKEYQALVFSAYANSLLIQFDPYSAFFTEESLKKFENSLSVSIESYGIRLAKNEMGQIYIQSLVPGSYAWRKGELKAGDLVYSIEHNGKTLITEGIMEVEASAFLESANGKLTIKVYDGLIEKVADVYKEAVSHDENFVQSFLLKGDIKTGYLSLPAFYTNWDQENNFGCAQDVGRALYELKKHDIDALILDLRDNGGGSLKEAIELAGLFIDFGNLLQEKQKDGLLTPIKDFNRGTMYTGPLVILINGASASASEMLAAILQDYNRALIIGSTSYGKATGQVVLPIHTSEGRIVEGQAIKTTTSEFIRITGQSYKGIGIVPDVVLPDYYSFYKNRPVFMMEADGPIKKAYFKAQNPYPVEALRGKSTERVAINPVFTKIDSIDKAFADYVNSLGWLSIGLQDYRMRLVDYNRLMDTYNSIQGNVNHAFLVEGVTGFNFLNNIDPHYAEIQDEAMKSILSDQHILETYNVLLDYHQLKLP